MRSNIRSRLLPRSPNHSHQKGSHPNSANHNKNIWRRERDSNPRSSFKPDTRLAGEPLRPLGHLSVAGQSTQDNTNLIFLTFVYRLSPRERDAAHSLANSPPCLPLRTMAEGVGFEPTWLSDPAVFKTAALSHSAIPPQSSPSTL